MPSFARTGSDGAVGWGPRSANTTGQPTARLVCPIGWIKQRSGRSRRRVACSPTAILEPAMTHQFPPAGLPVPEPRKKRRWVWWLGGVFGVLMFLVVLGTIVGPPPDRT